MNRNNLIYQAAKRRQEGFALNPDFTSTVMKRIARRQKLHSVIEIAAAIIAMLGAVAVGVYYLLPSINEIHISLNREILPAIISASLLCLLLFADSMLRRKFFAEK